MTSAPDLFPIVDETGELLVIHKPAGLVCHPTKGDAYSSLISRLRLHLRSEEPPQLINRLDRETSGLILVAKNLQTARELRNLWEHRQVEKQYLALVHGALPEHSGVISAPLGKDPASAVAIKDCVRADGQPAETAYAVEKQFTRNGEAFSLVRLAPRTGRKHQIRIHLAHLGCPIVGDKIYGRDEKFYLDFVHGVLTDAQRSQLILPFQALHAASVRFDWHGRSFHFETPPEPWFRAFHETTAS